MARINDNFTLRAPVPIDDKKGWWDDSTGEWKPFNDVQHALDTVVYYRYRTLTLPVVDGGDVVEYWFKDGVEDSDFVQKSSAIDLSNYYTKVDLQTSGQAQVHWDNITNVPDLSVLWENIGGDQSSVEVGGFSNTIGYITGVSWGDITGNQSVIGNAGFTNDAGYITLSDVPIPDYSTLPGFGLSWNPATSKMDWGEHSEAPGFSGGQYVVTIPEASIVGLGDINSSDASFLAVKMGGLSSTGLTVGDRSTAQNIGVAAENLGVQQIRFFSPNGNMTYGSDGVLNYSIDKSSSYTNRSVVDKEYVDSLIPDLTGYATESWVISQGYLDEVPWAFDVNTGDLTINGVTNNLDGRWLERADGVITSGYGITVNGDLATGMGIELDTTVVDNRYLRKDVSDSNGAFTLTLGELVSGNAEFTGTVTLGSVATGTTNEILLYGPGGVVQRKTLDFGGSFGIANSGGTKQFDVDLGTNLRFEGTGDTVVSFNSSTNTITINSVPGQGGGGVITSVFGRTGPAILAVAGDYNTSQVTESTNLYFTAARVRATQLSNYVVGPNAAISTSDHISQAFGKAQGQINARVPTSRTVSISGTSGNIAISGTPTQNLGSNAAWTINLATVGSAGANKTKVTTDAYGRVIASAALTLADLPSTVTQTLTHDPNASFGNISISGGNTINLSSIIRNTAEAGTWNSFASSVSSGLKPFASTTGSTGFPSTASSGFIVNRNGAGNVAGAMAFGVSATESDVNAYFNVGLTSTTWTGWKTIADKDWVTDGFVTTNTNQTGLSGNKTWTGSHYFAGTASNPVILVSSTNINSSNYLSFSNNNGTRSGYIGFGSSLEDRGMYLYTDHNAPINLVPNGNSTMAVHNNSVQIKPAVGSSSVAQRTIDIGNVSASQGVFIRGGNNSANTQSFILRGYSSSGVQLELNEGGISFPVGGSSGLFAGNNNILYASTAGSTVIGSVSSGQLYLRPYGVGSTSNEAMFGSSIRLNALSGSGTQMVVANASGVLSRQAIPAVGVTSVSAGNGMNFTTITGTGAVTLGTPGTLTASTSNGVTSTSHTHAITTTTSGAANTIVQTNASGVITASGGNSTQWNEAYGWGDYRQWGLGTFTNNNGTVADANTPSETQFFSGNTTTTNRPPGSGHTYIHIGRASTIANQLAFDYDNDEVYFRRLRTTWGAWNKFWHDGNLTGAATTIVTSNLTANRALVSNGSGKVAVSAVTSTELGYLDGVTSSIQTQLNGKAPTSHTHTWSQLSGGSTALIPGAGSGGSYGSLDISGSKASFSGIRFTSASNNATFMIHNTEGRSGFWAGAWVWQWNADGSLATGTVPWARLSSYPTITAGTGLSGGGAISSGVTINHAAHTGDVTGATALTIANNAVTTAKINNQAVTFAKIVNINTQRLIGRSTTGAGSVEQISLGANLTLSAGVLSATNTVYTLPTATATTLGGIELFSNTVQSVAANAVSATASRTYGIQLNSAGQAVVNVPWTDSSINLVTVGSTSVGAIEYAGVASVLQNGKFWGGTFNPSDSPSSAYRLNYGGEFRASRMYSMDTLWAKNLELGLSVVSSGTTINMEYGFHRLPNITASTTYTLSNNTTQGRGTQCIVTNTNSSNNVTVTVTGATLLGSNIVQSQQQAVISIINFGDGRTVYTVVSGL